MDIIKITAVGLAGAALSVMLKKDCPHIALCVSAAGCIVIMCYVLPKVGAMLSLLERAADMMKGESAYVKLVLKLVAVAYVSSLGSRLCKDAGESALGEKIELGGKVVILIFSLPVISGLLDMLTELMP